MNINFEIDRHLLVLAVSRIQKAVSDRTLSFVSMRTKKNEFEIAVNDQFQAVYSKFACKSTLPDGFCFVGAQLFCDVVKELPEGVVKLFVKDNMLWIVAGKGQEFLMKLPLVEDGVWREQDTYSTEDSAEISASKLSYMIEQVNFCIVNDSPRNFGTVGFLHRPKHDLETLRLVGTDSYRLSYCDIRIPMPDVFLKQGICLTKKALGELLHMASEGFEKIRLTISNENSCLVAEAPDYKLYLRLSSVKFPNYVGVLPKWDGKALGVLINRNYMQTVARRVLLASDKARVLNLSFAQSELTLASKTVGSSEGKEKIPLQEYAGPLCDMAVNGKYLTDVFSSTSCDKMTLQFKTPAEPFILMPYGEPADCKTKHVLVPIDQQHA